MKYLRQSSDGFIWAWNQSLSEQPGMQLIECDPSQVPADGYVHDLVAFLTETQGKDSKVVRGRPAKVAE